MLSRCFEVEATLEEKWNDFSGKLTTQARELFEVYFGINIETRQGITAEVVRSIIQSLAMIIRRGSEIIDGDPARSNLYNKLDSSRHYIVVSVDATDLYSATLSAINQLNKQLSVATFYNTINPWIANSPQIVTFCPSTQLAEALKITDVFRTYDYVDSTNNVFEDTKNILINPEKAHIMARLHAAFSYTNLSRTSLFQETKYISLWIAIESVMRTGQYPDIISHIKCVLPETLSVRYVYRIIRNFSEDCIRCGFKQEPALAVNMESTDKKQLIAILITIFRDPDLYNILEQNCQINKLLNYRCTEIHALLNNTQLIISKFESYTTKIRWHIQRLYRIRNEITHSAFFDDRSLTIYIEHLYTYLAQLVSEVVYYVEHKQVKSVEEAFSIILENYNTYLDLLKTGYFVPQDVLPNGVVEIIS